MNYFRQIRRCVKVIIAGILYYSGILDMLMRMIIAKRKEFPGLILNYHHFCNDLSGEINPLPAVSTTVTELNNHLRFFKKYFDVLAYDDFIDRLKTKQIFVKPTITITANDGLIDNMALMVPALEKDKIPMHMFLVVGFIGTNWMLWTDKIGQMLLRTDKKEYRGNAVLEFEIFPLETLKQKRKAYDKIVETLKNVSIFSRFRYIGEMKEELGILVEDSPVMIAWDDVKYLQEKGVTFGSETMTHPILSKMLIDGAQEEILKSKKILEEKLGVPVKHFAVPNGREKDFTDDLREYCRAVGYESILMDVYGTNRKSEDVWNLCRINPDRPVCVFIFEIVRLLLKGKG